MPNLLHSCSDAFESYRKWVAANPQTIGDLETTLKWASYFVAGRMSSSPVITELTYSLSNLLVLFNDQIIAQSQPAAAAATTASSTPRANPSSNGSPAADPAIRLERNRRRLQLLLTTLEYCEVFIEMSARQVWGEPGRWFFVCAVQLLKCAFRLLLTLRCGAAFVSTPAMRVLNRKEVGQQRATAAADADADADESAAGDAFGAHVNASFELRRSGKIVRCVEGAPPLHLRSWRPPQRRLTAAERLAEKQGGGGEGGRRRGLTAAEFVYIARPLVHLGGCGMFGLNSWRSYGMALAMDAYSLHLYNQQSASLSAAQRLELSRRNVQLLMYLVRSPFYDRYTRDRIRTLVDGIGRRVPMTGAICTALNEYIPHWQSIYFYMWSS